ncbi:MAG: hypothetical protein U5L04_17175 [Trueperaceae bacterium]|nr:hypothetical protein [Trueperaceae bacterium]
MATDIDTTLLRRIADEHGTPTYVYNLAEISDKLGTLRQELPGTLIHYAVKANPSGGVLRYLAAQGVGAEVITVGELARALRAGIPASDIIVGGPGQDEALIREAAEQSIGLVSLDSASQYDLWERQTVGLTSFLVRLNPGLDPRTHEHLATGAATSKFGLLFDDAKALAERVDASGRLAGFHVHAGSQISDLAVYDEIFAQLSRLYEAFPACKTLDIGGGFAVPGFPLAAFALKVSTFAEQFGVEVRLEPGRYLVAEAGTLLTRVRHVKPGGPVTHVIADAGMADLLRPALYDADHPIRSLEDRELENGGDDAGSYVDVDGPLCENADRLGRERAR